MAKLYKGGVLSDFEGVLVKITPHYAEYTAMGDYYYPRFSVMDGNRVIALYAILPNIGLVVYFYVTFIGTNYYAFWPGSEELYQCNVLS